MNNFSKRLAGLSLGLLLTLGVGVAGGHQDVVKTDAVAPTIAELTFPDDNSSSNGLTKDQYISTWKATSSTNEWSIVNFNNNNWQNSWSYIKCGRKNNVSVATISNTTALANVASITVTIGSCVDTKVNSFYVECGTDANDITKNKIEKTIGKGDIVFELGTTEYSYFKITFDCASNNNNGFVQLNKVTYYGEDIDPNVKFDDVPTTAFDVDKDTEKEALAYTTKHITTVNSATWSSSDENVVTIDSTTGKFKTVGGGTATITLSLTYDDATEPVTASALINVNYADALSVDEAYTKIMALTTSDITTYTAPIKGKADTINPASATSSKATYTVNFKTSDDKTIQVFFGAYLEKAPEGFDKILVGSTVTFKGNFQKYTDKYGNVTPELVNPSIVSVEYDASVYSKYFLSSLTSICSDVEKDNSEALKPVWIDLKAKWADVDEASKETLKNAATDDATYGEFAKKYDHIMTRYGEAKLGEGANFIGRTVTASATTVRGVLTTADNSLTITIIVLVSVISVSLIVGTTLIIRKRKFN